MNTVRIIRTTFLALIIFASNLFSAWEAPETGTTGDVRQMITYQDKLFAVSYTGGVFITVNNGMQWLSRNTGIDTMNVNCIAYVDNTVFIGTDKYGVYMTTNLGDKWTHKNDDGLGKLSIYSMTQDNSKIYALTDEAGVYMSSDKGTSWNPINNGDIIGINVFSIKAVNDTVYVGAQDGHIYTTTDKGVNWSDLRSTPLVFNVKAIDVKGSNIIAGTSNGVFISTNKGVSWTICNSGLKSLDITDVRFHGNLIYVATRGAGVYISDNAGANWYAVNDQLPDFNVLSLNFNSTYIYAGSVYSAVCRRLISEIKVPELTAPVLVSPVDNEQNVDFKVTFSWSECLGAKSYHLQLALSNDFSNPIQEKNDLMQTSWGTTLQKGTEYYWRVGSNGSNNQILWSSASKFTTKVELTAATLIYPPSDGKDIERPVKFVWNQAPGAVSYQFHISQSEQFDSLYQKTGLTDTVFVYENLSKDSIYYWRILSVGSDNKNTQSEVRKFTAGKISSVYETIDNKSGLFELNPNPVFAVLNLKSLTNIENVSVDLIDVRGEVISNLYRGDIYSDQMISASAESLSTGTYFLRISSKDKNYILRFIKN